MRALFVLLLLMASAAADEIAVDVEGACCPPMTITDIPRGTEAERQAAAEKLREQAAAIRESAESLGLPSGRSESTTVTIIRNMKREQGDPLPSCSSPMSDSRPLPSNWPCR